MDTPYQPTGSGKWIWRQPLTRDVVEFGTLSDPRDARISELEAEIKAATGVGVLIIDVARQRDEKCKARIAQLEAALREIRERTSKHNPLSVQDVLIMRAVDAVLPRPPEGDMTMTVEDLQL